MVKVETSLGVSIGFAFVLLMFSLNRVFYYLIVLEFVFLGVFYSSHLLTFMDSILLNVSFMSMLACEAAMGLSLLILIGNESPLSRGCANKFNLN